MLKSITTIDELKDSVKNNNIAVIDLYATWCKPCQEMLPVIEEISNTTEIPFFKVDIDEVPEAKAFTGAKAVPMLYMYKDGRIREFAYGVNDKSKIEMKLKRVMRV
jgi:thioredoxin 1